MEDIFDFFYDIVLSDLKNNEKNQIMKQLVDNLFTNTEDTLQRICILKIVDNYNLTDIYKYIPENFSDEILARKIIVINQYIDLHNYQVKLYSQALKKNINTELRKQFTTQFISLWNSNYIRLKEDIKLLGNSAPSIIKIYLDKLKNFPDISNEYLQF